MGGSCELKGDVGDACADNGQCKNDQCVDGVCCGDVACAGCNTCAASGHKGQCWPMPPGDSKGYCLPELPESCGQTGECDGLGSCAMYDATTLCQPASCPVGTSEYLPASYCNGTGSCSFQATSTCDAYACKSDGSNTCNTDCAGDGDCSSGNTCQSMICNAP
jgi:hypothetical protein